MKLVFPDAKDVYQRLVHPQISQEVLQAMNAQMMSSQITSQQREAALLGKESEPIPQFIYRPSFCRQVSPAKLPQPFGRVQFNYGRDGNNYHMFTRFFIYSETKGVDPLEGFSTPFGAKIPQRFRWASLDNSGKGYLYNLEDKNNSPVIGIDGDKVSKHTHVRDISVGFRGARPVVLDGEDSFQDMLLNLGIFSNYFVNSALDFFVGKSSGMSSNPADLTVFVSHI